MVNATVGYYNLTPSSEATDVLGFVGAVNDLTGQVFMIGVLLVAFVIAFTAMMRFGTSDALLASGFVTTILAVLFNALDFVPRFIVFLIVILYGAFFTYRMVNG